MSLTGDAMAHAILPGAAVGFLVAGLSLPAMTLGGLAAGLAVALLAGLVSRTTVLREDATLAGFYLISLAAGVLIVSLRGSNVDLMHVLFGTVLALDDRRFCCSPASPRRRCSPWPCCGGRWCSSASIGVPALGQPDQRPRPRRAPGAGGVNLVGGFQALGTLLAVGLMILPAAAARFWARDLGAADRCWPPVRARGRLSLDCSSPTMPPCPAGPRSS